MLKKTDGTYFEGDREVEKPSVAIIGAGFGGLSAAMLLSEKGYNVHVFDRLQTVGGRGSSKTQEGHRFDLGPTCLLYTSPSPRDGLLSRMPSSA